MMKCDVSYQVPRSVWDWATKQFDDAFCADIWQFVYLRERYKMAIRRTASLLLTSFLLVAIALPLLAHRYTGSSDFLIGFLFVACIFVIASCRRIQQLKWAIIRVQCRHPHRWTLVGGDLVDRLYLVKPTDKKVTVSVQSD